MAELRSDAARNLERVLDTALRVLGQQPQASMEQVAGASGVHRSTVYRRFPTREALIDALIERALAELRLIVGGAGRGELDEVRFRRFCHEALAAGERYAFLAAHLRIGEPGPDPVGLVQVMRRYQRAGVVRIDRPATWLAASFTALGAALFGDWATWTETPSGAARLLADTFLDGLGSRPEAP